MLLEWSANGDEPANNLKELAERGLPGVAAVVGADTVGQCQTRTAGPAQDGHFGFVLSAVGNGAVHHVNDSGTLDQGHQKLAFIGKSAVALMLCDKGSDRIRVVGGGHAVGFKPLKYPPRTLEPRGVHQGIEGLAVHFQRIGQTLYTLMDTPGYRG